MKQMASIFLFVILYAWSNEPETDVMHMLVNYNGETIIGSIDSVGQEFIRYIPRDSVDFDSVYVRDIYYVYNDFGRTFHYSWSFEQNINKMENRTGHLFTLSGDTLEFFNIKFNEDMIHPEVYINTGVNRTKLISLYQVEKIVTDYSILEYSIRKGFYYSFFSFLIAATIDVPLKWDDSRRSAPQIWDQFNDLLPKMSLVGMRETGVTYESVSFLIPISVLSSMVYDIWKNKNTFYFTPVWEEKKFGRNMYVFSFRHIAYTYTQRMIFRIEKTKFGGKVVGWIRKKVS